MLTCIDAKDVDEKRLSWWDEDRRRVLHIFIAVGILVACAGLVRSSLVSWPSISVILVVASFVGYVGVGQTLVFLVGGIDFSVVWVLNASAILVVAVSGTENGRLLQGLLVALGMGVVVGLVNGVGIAFFEVPAIVMTLGTNGVVGGLAMGFSNGLTCNSCKSPTPSVLNSALNGKVAGLIPGHVVLWVGVILAISLILSATVLGRRVYASGVNPTAAFLSGVPVRRVVIALYGISGLFAALAGVTLAAFSNGASLGLGDPYLFESIAAAVIGGVSILGGRGKYIGTVGGALVIVLLVTILQVEEIPQYARNMLYGAVILAVLLAFGRQRKST